MVSDVETGKRGKYYVHLAATIAALGGLLFGYDLSIISGAMIFLKREFGLTENQVGFATSSALLGCIAGPFLGATLADRIGRKKSLFLSALLFGTGAIGTALPHSMAPFYISRMVGGMGVGLASVVSPMYIAEIAPARMRGLLVTINQLAIVTGSMISVVVAYELSFQEAWRWMFASNCIPVLMLIGGLLLVPESPRWLIKVRREPEALDVLRAVEGESRAEEELREITQSFAQKTGTLMDLVKPGMRTAVMIACALAIFQQITGVSILLMYSPIVFQKAGIANASSAILRGLLVSVWVVVCTIVALSLVDRVGRRPLLLTGIAGMAVGLALMAVFFAHHSGGQLVLLTMFISVGAYVISLAPLAWLIMSEIFPTHLRGKAMGLASLCLWVSSFLTAQYFPPLAKWFEDRHGSPAGVFWIYAFICAAALIFSWRMVPETKGRTLEEIGASWSRKKVDPQSAP